jgi:hypothetical protein
MMWRGAALTGLVLALGCVQWPSNTSCRDPIVVEGTALIGTFIADVAFAAPGDWRFVVHLEEQGGDVDVALLFPDTDEASGLEGIDEAQLTIGLERREFTYTRVSTREGRLLFEGGDPLAAPAQSGPRIRFAAGESGDSCSADGYIRVARSLRCRSPLTAILSSSSQVNHPQ